MTFQEWLMSQPVPPTGAYELSLSASAFAAGCEFSLQHQAQCASKNAERYTSLRAFHCLPTKHFNRVIARVSNSPDGTPAGFDNRADAVIAALAAEGL